MPEGETRNQKGEVKHWWVPILIGVILLMAPGGAYLTPAMIIASIILKLRKPRPKPPETSPSPLIPIKMGVAGL
jgi:hypothetical protein